MPFVLVPLVAEAAAAAGIAIGASAVSFISSVIFSCSIAGANLKVVGR